MNYLADHNSSIDSYNGTEQSLEIVFNKIKQAELPIKWYFENIGTYTVCNFVYANGVCDGNTSYALERIIRGLMYLYGK